MYSRVLAFVVVFLSLAVAAYAQSAPTLRDIHTINGFDEAIAELESSFRGAFDQYPGPKPEQLVDAWRVAQEGAFDSERLIPELEALVAGQLKPEEIADLLDFYKSDLGMHISQVEIAATLPEVKPIKEAEGAALYATLGTADPERLALYNNLMEGLHAVDVSEAIALNITYAMVSAMLGGAKQPATDEQIAAIVKQNTATLRAAIENHTTSHTAWTYRNVSMEDLRRYVAFLETPAAKRYYASILLAFDRVFTAEARALGNKLMIALGQRKA